VQIDEAMKKSDQLSINSKGNKNDVNHETEQNRLRLGEKSREAKRDEEG